MSDAIEPRDLVRLARAAPGKLADLFGGLPLERQVELTLSIPHADRVGVLLAAPRPMRLVRSLSEGDLYLTVREAGPSDALPVLALASPAQITHLFDLESWRGDRFDAARAGAWTAVLFEADPSALRRLARAADDSLLALLLRRWARAHPIETDDQTPVHGSGETESGDERGFVSPCGYYRLDPAEPRHTAAVRRLAEQLFLDDPERYFRLLWSTTAESDSELEEDGLRWRASRLEEHGYPPFDEAMEVYAAPRAIGRATPPLVLDDSETASPAPRWAAEGVPAGGALARALAGASTELVDTVRRELVATAARVLVADGLDAGDPAAHRAAARKAAGLAQIGIESLARDQGLEERELLERHPVLELFRHGHEKIAVLARRARAMVAEGWPQNHPEWLARLDEPLRGRVAGLLVERPAHLENDPTGAERGLRDFEALAEVDETRAALELAEAIGGLFARRLGVDLGRVARADQSATHAVRFSTLLLTTLAWHAARSEIRLEPLPADVVADFLRTVASRRTAPPDAPERALEALLCDLAADHGLDVRETGLARAFGRACLERLASECAALDPGTPVDDRHVSCLLLRSREAPRVG